MIDDARYMDECPYEHFSPFMQIEGHRKELCWGDFAHLDPLGLGRDLGAALIKSMLLRGELGEGSLDAQLRAAWFEFNDDRKRRGKTNLQATSQQLVSAWTTCTCHHYIHVRNIYFGTKARFQI